MGKYVKLGPVANSFCDPYSGFDIAGKEVKLLTKEQEKAPRIKRAISTGHLTASTLEEFNKFIGTPIAETTSKFDGKTGEELLEYYKENWEVSEAEEKKFLKKDLKEMVKFLDSLEGE